MSREMGVITLGIVVIITPYLGIPGSWRTVLLVLAGIAITILGFLLRGQIVSNGVKKTEHHPFAESNGRISDFRHHAEESHVHTNTEE